MKKNTLILLFLLSLLINGYFIYKCNIKNSADTLISKKSYTDYKEGLFYKFNTIQADFHSDANFVRYKGLYSKLNDTVSIQPFLKAVYLTFGQKNQLPLISLYSYSDTDSNFKLIDTIRYKGNYSFKYINRDTCTKLLFYRINLPVGDSIEKFDGAFMLQTEINNHQMSKPFSPSVLYHLFGRFHNRQ